MAKPVTGQTTFGASTSGTTTQLDNNFLLAYNALNDLNTYPNYFVDAGSANAMSVTLAAGLTGALTDGLTIQVKVKASNTGATTMNYNAGGAIAVTNLDGSALSSGQLPINGIVTLSYSSSAGAWILQTPFVSSAAATVTVPVRQTILTCPADSSGVSTLIPASCTSLNLTTANITSSAPLIVTSANGFTSSGANNIVGISSANLTWTCTANAVNYLAVQVAANGNLTAIAVSNANGAQPTIVRAGSYSSTNGNYTWNNQEAVMKLGNGTGSSQTFTVFVGEANCNSNAVVTGLSYQRLYTYNPTITLLTPTASTSGTSIDYTGLPDGIRNLALTMTNTSTNGSSPLQTQFGTVSALDTSGYLGGGSNAGGTWTASTTGFLLKASTHAAADAINGVYFWQLSNQANSTWNGFGGAYWSSTAQQGVMTGAKSLTSRLGRFRLVAQNGTDTFDAGEVNLAIQYQ